MTNIAKTLTDKARESGKIKQGSQFFAVTEKKQVIVNGEEITVEVPNGKHRVVILSEKLGKGKSYDGKEQDQWQLVITDNGVQKQWDMPYKNADGTLYYIVEQLAEVDLNEPFNIEAMKMKNGKYAKKITKIAKGESEKELPTISYDDDSEEPAPSLEAGGGEEDIHPEDVPF